jgi:hypothetical protein
MPNDLRRKILGLLEKYPGGMTAGELLHQHLRDGVRARDRDLVLWDLRRRGLVASTTHVTRGPVGNKVTRTLWVRTVSTRAPHEGAN